MAHTRQFSDDIQQQFPFKRPLLKYIFDNINYKHLYKFYQCCKFFPNKFPLVIIREINYFSPHLFYNKQPIAPIGSKIWLTECIRHNEFRQWISDIWICTIKYLSVYQQDLSLSEFEMLTQSGNIEELRVSKILKKNGTCLAVEEIVSYAPKAWRIGITNPRITSETFMKLVKMEQKYKIEEFLLDKVNVKIDPDEYLKFIETHASPTGFSQFSIWFTADLSNGYVKNLCNFINDEIIINPKFKNFDIYFVGMIIDP